MCYTEFKEQERQRAGGTSLKTMTLLKLLPISMLDCSHFNSLYERIYLTTEIFLVSLFFNYSLVYFLINIYSDSSQLALKYLKNTEVNIGNILIITRDFNIRDSIWDSHFLHHSFHSEFLFEVIDSFYLELSRSTEQVSIRYLDNQ